MIKIIFSALDEAQNLKKLLVNLGHEMQLLGRDFEVIACLDGTKDDSKEVLEEFQKFHSVKILPIIDQRGLGLAYKRLFIDVLKNSADDDLILSLDADNTHDVEQIPDMLKHFEEKNLDLVVASRFCNSSVLADFPPHRQFISKSTSIILQNLFCVKRISGEKLQDFTSGYRLYRVKKLRELHEKLGDDFILEPEFTYTCELLIKLAQIGARIDEIPISYDYGKKIGKSKLRIMRNFTRLMILITKLSFAKKKV